jgi:hypothetical protein
MYFNPSYMNPIAQQPMQQEFSQQPTQEPLEGIASLTPTQPSPPSTMQPIPPQMTPPPGGIQPIPDFTTKEDHEKMLQPLLPELIGDTGLPFDMSPITPYVQNENLDLTNRGSIMEEYNKYLQGGMGSNIHTADMQSGYSFMDQAMGPGSSTGFSDFRNFLDTFGIGDRLKNNQQQLMQDAIGKLQQAEPGQSLNMGKYEPVNNQEGIQSLSAYQSQQNTGPGI